MRRKPKSGFTLIELSIVLVIIGLLVGGVLVGRDLVEAALMRREVATIEQYVTAMNTFRLKYNCKPGDCANASQYFSGAFNGNGNGVIDNSAESGETEAHCWNGGAIREFGATNDHLARAALINQESYDPANAASCAPGRALLKLPSQSALCATVGFVGHRNLLRLGCLQAGFSSQFYYAIGTSSARAWRVDGKIDDGKPRSGNVIQSYQATAGGGGGPSWWYELCTQQVNGVYEYILTSNEMKTIIGVDVVSGCPLWIFDRY